MAAPKPYNSHRENEEARAKGYSAIRTVNIQIGISMEEKNSYRLHH